MSAIALIAGVPDQRSRRSLVRDDEVYFPTEFQNNRYTATFSRRETPEVCVSLSLTNEGAGNAGCALHPRSRVQIARVITHTSIQGSGEHPTFPAQGRVWAEKIEIIQRDELAVSSFVSRSAGVIICCGELCDAADDGPRWVSASIIIRRLVSIASGCLCWQ